MKYHKTIGILGGMGPAATVNFFDKIVRATQAGCDQDHPRIVVDCNPKIPDRTAAILQQGTDPLPTMLRSLRFLESAPVDMIAIPCVTAHYYHARLQAETTVPILHFVRETMVHLREHYPHIRRIGAISTTGTARTGLIADICAESGLTLFSSQEPMQTQRVMAAIYRIKAEGVSPEVKAWVREAADTLVQQGAQAILAGCTEIPLVLADGELAVPVLDPIAILAERILHQAGA